jgi:hypothetical protein
MGLKGRVRVRSMIKLRFDVLTRKQENALSESASRLYRKFTTWGDCETCSNALRRRVWPDLLESSRADPRLVVVPLERIGASPGASGSSVFVGYFIDKANAHTLPSRPLVIKLSFREEDPVDKCRDEDERARTIEPYTDYEARIAAPIWLDDQDDTFSALWSPFASAGNIWDEYGEGRGGQLNLAVRDLWGVLRSDLDVGDASKVLDEVYWALSPLHLAGGAKRQREAYFAIEYEKYLRGLPGDDSAHWQRWRHCWGAKEQASDFNKSWPNPFRVLERVVADSTPKTLTCGAVHGDLHPKNIVLTLNDSPRIIDLGWAARDSHIAKDFLLLEANLRSLVVPAAASYASMEQYAQWVDMEEPPPTPLLNDPVLGKHVELVRKLRTIAQRRFPDGADYTTEYLIPLFIVTFGLLKYFENADNQIAGRLTVLHLAKQIEARIFSVPPESRR